MFLGEYDVGSNNVQNFGHIPNDFRGPAEKFQILRFECFPTEWGNSLHNVNNSYGESPSRNPLGTSVLPIETFILLTMPFQKSLKYHSSKSLLIR